jgi:hypothetical protein
MFLYRVKYTESEYDIQNNDLFYKIHQQHHNTFQTPDSSNISKHFKQSKYLLQIKFIFYNM